MIGINLVMGDSARRLPHKLMNVAARARPAPWLFIDRLARFTQRALLPDALIAPLRRRGLDPVDGSPDCDTSPPIRRVSGIAGKKIWLITGYPEARAVLADSSTFSNDFRTLTKGSLLGRHRSPGGLGFTDPPDHSRLRRLLTPEFSRRRLITLEPVIREIVADQLDVLAGRGEIADLWSDFALPVPTATICELLGIPGHQRARFQRLSTARFDLLNGPSASLAAVSDSLDALLGVIRVQRLHPGPGLIGRLLEQHGDELEDEELAGLADGILTGGLESTASMLALGTITLLRDAALAESVRAETDVAATVDELLRYLTVVQVAFPRFATRDIDITGRRIAAGDVVLCSLVAANRHPAYGPDAHVVSPHRRAPTHLAFGHGIHRCIGAELARIELQVAYPALLRRFPRMALATPLEELPFRQGSIVYGLDELPVRLSGPSVTRLEPA